MAASEAITRILWHAGLPFPSPGTELPQGSISTATWSLAGIDEAREDLLRTLERLNLELNGSVPSATGDSRKANDFPRQLVWAVEGILRQLEEALTKSDKAETKEHITATAEKVKFWWRCVLDGDIDDIGADWEDHLQTR